MRPWFLNPSRLRSLLRKDRVEDELDEELLFHLDKEIEKNVAAGMSREQAQEDAFQRFENLQEIKASVFREVFPRNTTAAMALHGGTMSKLRINRLAVLMGSILYCAVGLVWYSGVRRSPLPLGTLATVFAGAVLLTFVFALLLNYYWSDFGGLAEQTREGIKRVKGAAIGAAMGFLLGVGFSATTLVTGTLFAGRSLELCVAQPVLGMAVMGAVLGFSKWRI